MSPSPNSPRLMKGGLVLLDPQTSSVLRVIALQYNPDTLSRTLQSRSVELSGENRSQALRLKGPPVETIQVEAVLDATDRLEMAEESAVQVGIHPELAALETLVYPTAATLLENHALAGAGTLQITPMESPLTLFVWSRKRIVPVRITEFSVMEEAFDVALNPIRARVTLGLRVLNVDDLGFSHRGGSLFMAYQQQKESLAAQSVAGTLEALGIGGLP